MCYRYIRFFGSILFDGITAFFNSFLDFIHACFGVAVADNGGGIIQNNFHILNSLYLANPFSMEATHIAQVIPPMCRVTSVNSDEEAVSLFSLAFYLPVRRIKRKNPKCINHCFHF